MSPLVIYLQCSFFTQIMFFSSDPQTSCQDTTTLCSPEKCLIFFVSTNKAEQSLNDLHALYNKEDARIIL